MKVVLLFLCVLLLAGCWNGRALLSFEQPFWSTLNGDSRLKAALTADALRHGYVPRIVVGSGGADPQKALVAAVSTGRDAVVVVGPLLSFDWASYVPMFPKARFVLIDAPVPTQVPPANAVFLTFDRTAAFREAGREAAQTVRARLGASGAAGSAVPGAELAPRIAVLTSADSDLSDKETDAFTGGVAETLDGNRPLTRALPAAPDRNVITSAVDQMRRAGAEIFLVGLGERNPVALEALRDNEASAVVADWAASGASAGQVLLSVEADVPGGITLAWDALRSGVGRVDGPVKLVAGKKI